MRVAVCIPIFNPGDEFSKLLQALSSQAVLPSRVLLIDSSARPAAGLTGLCSPFELRRINGKDFDHGGTRRLAMEILAGQEVVVFLTQDAIPSDPTAIGNLIACFGDEKVGAAYGCQAPRPGAHPVESHARRFNYSTESLVKSPDSIALLGIKAAFISNSFAAYRRTALDIAGGFPERCIVSEDTFVAAKMLLAGWKIAYCAEAQVFHSHDYCWRQEFRRYFDIGVFHAREPWVRKEFGGAEGEGWRFLKSELKYLFRKAPHLIPSSLVRTSIKYFGFRAGLLEYCLPLALKRRLSMQRAFWNAEMGEHRCSRNRPGSSTG